MTEICVFKISFNLRKIQNLRPLQRLASWHEQSLAIFKILLNIYCTVKKCMELSVTTSDIYTKNLLPDL
jgi:hypothetical protein